MASPQRPDPDQFPEQFPRSSSSGPRPVAPAPRSRRDGPFGWWILWLVLFIAAIVWFCGWGWFGYGGWWSHSRGTTPPTYQSQPVKPAPGTAATPGAPAPAPTSSRGRGAAGNSTGTPGGTGRP